MSLTLNQIRDTFGKLDQAQMNESLDKLFTLEENNPLAPKSKPSFFRARKSGTDTPGSIARFKKQLLQALRRDFIPPLNVDAETQKRLMFMSADEETVSYFDELSETLDPKVPSAGKGGETSVSDSKSLTARDVYQFIDDNDRRQREAELRYFRSMHKELVSDLDRMQRDIQRMQGRSDLDEKWRKQMETCIKCYGELRTKFLKGQQAVDHGDATQKFLEDFHASVQASMKIVLDAGAADLFAKDRESVLTGFKNEAEKILHGFDESWQETFAKDVNLTDDDRQTFKAELEKKLQSFADDLAAQKGVADYKTAPDLLKTLQESAAKALAEMKTLVDKQIEAAERKSVDREDIKQAGDGFKTSCENALKNLDDCLGQEKAAFAERWKGAYGTYCEKERTEAEKALDETIATFRQQAQEARKTALKEAEKHDGSTTVAAFKERLAAVQKDFVDVLKGLHEEFLRKTDEIHESAEQTYQNAVAKHQVEQLADAAKTAFEAFKQAVEDHKGDFGDANVAEQLVREKQRFVEEKTTNTEGLTPNAMKERFTTVIQSLNDGYAKISHAKLDLQKATFELRLQQAKDDFHTEANTRIQYLRSALSLTKGAEACESIIALLNAQVERNVNEIVATIRADTEIQAENRPDFTVKFNEALSELDERIGKLISKARDQAANAETAKTQLVNTVESLVSTKVDLYMALEKLEQKKGSEVARRYLQGRIAQLNDLLRTAAERTSEDLSKYSVAALDNAVKQMKSYADTVKGLAARFSNGDLTAANFVGRLRLVVTPEIRLWSFLQEISDADELEDISLTAEARALTGVEQGLSALKANLAATLELFNGPNDALARQHLRGLAKEALTKATVALNQVAKMNADKKVGERPVELGQGVAAILQNVWSGVAQLTVQLRHDKLMSAFAAKMGDIRTRLSQATRPQAKLKADALAKRQASVRDALRDVDRIEDALRAKMNDLLHSQQLPDANEWKAFLDRLDENVGVYLQQFSRANAKSFDPLSMDGILADNDVGDFVDVTSTVPLTGKTADPLTAMAQGNYATLQDLNGAIEAAKRQTAEQKANERLDSWNAYVLEQNDRIAIQNEERNLNADKTVGEILKEPMRTFKANDARGTDLQRQIEENNRKLQEEQEKAAQERAALRANSKEAKQLEQLRKAEEARLLLEERKTARKTFDSKFGKAISDCGEKMRKDLEALFFDCPGVDRYILRDSDNNFAGWTPDGEKIIGMALEKHLDTVHGTAFEYFLQTNKTEAGAFVVFTDEASRKDLNEARLAYEAKLGLAPKLGDDKVKSPYPRGANLFGLDVARLSEAQKNGLTALVIGLGVYPHATPAEFQEHLLNRHIGNNGGDGYFEIEQALHDGRLRLEEITENYVSAIYLAKAMSDGVRSLMRDGLRVVGIGESDFMRVYELFKAAGISPRLFETQKGRDVVVMSVLPVLYAYNSNSLDGLAAVCQRLFGYSVEETVGILAAGDKDTRFAALNKRCSELLAGGDDRTQADWRAIADQYVRMKPVERMAVGIVRMEYDYGADDVANLKAFRQALQELAAKGKGGQVTVKLTQTTPKDAVSVVLTRGEGDSFSASFLAVSSHYETKKDGTKELKYESKPTVPVPVHVPVTLTMVQDQLSRVILSQVDTYLLPEAQAILRERRDAVGHAVFDQSSEARQMVLSILKGYAGLDATRLSTVSTPDLVDLVLEKLAPQGPLAHLEGLKAKKDRASAIEASLKSDPLARGMLNAQATLDVYQRYLNAPQVEKNKVFVPEPPSVHKGETLEEARARRLHAFVSELIQPGDTTKFDLDYKRHEGRPSAVLRDTLVANSETLLELMRMGDKEIFDLFVLKGQGRDLTGFAEAVGNLVKALRDIRNGEASDEDFLARLGNETDVGTEEVIDKARLALVKSSGETLEHLQTAFVTLFTDAFGKLSASNADPVWKKSLDELAKTVNIDPNQGYGNFLKQVLGSYFVRMSPVDRSRMTALVMRYATSSASIGQTLGALLKGAGPILQKLMQGLPQSALPPELQEAVEDLKSNLAPIPEEAVRAYLYDAVAGSKGEITGITVLKSLGAASVGQAFLCKVMTKAHPEGEECVIKILRPDVQSRARREKEFFTAMIKETKTGDMLNDRFDRIFDEFDLSIEAANIVSGGVYDPDTTVNGSPRVRSMKLHPAGPVSSNILFLKRAPGETYDRYLAQVREEKERLLSHLDRKIVDGNQVYVPKDVYALSNARVQTLFLMKELTKRQRDLADFVAQWTEEVAFGNGFFHGDVHAGNIMTSPTGLTVIDYGNASRFTPEQRAGILQMLINATFNDPDKFLDNFKKLLTSNGQSQFKSVAGKSVVEDLTTIFSKGGRAEVGKRFIAALQYLQNLGVELPGPLFNLMECMRRLDESVSSLAAELASLREIHDSLAASEKNEYPYWFDIPLQEARENNKEFDQREAKAFIRKGLLEACTSRQAFEMKIADVRRLLARSDVFYRNDLHKLLAEALATAESDPDFFNPDLSAEDREARHQAFAARVASVVVMIQSHLEQQAYEISGDVKNIIPSFGHANDFTEAIGTAVERHVGTVRSAVGVVSGIAKWWNDEIETDPVEVAYKHRLVQIDGYLSQTSDFAMTSQERDFLQPFGVYFRTPFGFDKTLANNSWPKTPATRKEVLDVFRHTLSRLKARMEKAKPLTSSKNPSELYARYLGAMFHARFEKSGFDSKTLNETNFNLLLQEAGEDGDLKAFLQALRTCSTTLPPIKSK